jgi:hypothetical protein
MLIERLKADPNLRLLCNFTTIPGQASFSRAYAYLANAGIVPNTHDNLTIETFKEKVVYHICRDSSAIDARETVPKKAEQKPQKAPKKRGKPVKYGGKRVFLPPDVELQLIQEPHISLEALNKQCAKGCKRSTLSSSTFWKGYKLHLDVSDWGYPITACVTGANVQDCKLAIPMDKMTEQKVTFCYSLMDAAYDAHYIKSFIESRDRVPIIDPKRRNNGTCPELDPARLDRYKVRTTVERSYSHLKDSLIPKAIYVKGHTKVSFVLFSAVLCLAALKHLQFLC